MHPKLDLAALPFKDGTRYPKRYQQVNGDITARRWQGVAVGLTAFGANRVVLPPGSVSSLRHWHTREDELVVVLEGELVMLTDEGETPMVAGDFASFPKGSTNAHCFVNRSAKQAVMLAIGNDDAADDCFYPDVGMRTKDGVYVAQDTGEPYPD
jgi:uncharacterized cupin superfamily protein